MADYVSVLKRAVEGLSDNTAEARGQVYEKARAALARQLETLSANLTPDQVDAQMSALDLAIQELEAIYPPDPESEPEPEAEPEPEPEPDIVDAPRLDPELESDTQAEDEPEGGPESEAEAASEPSAEGEAQDGTEDKATTENTSDEEAEPDSELSDSPIPAEQDVEPDTDAEADKEPDPEPENSSASSDPEPDLEAEDAPDQDAEADKADGPPSDRLKALSEQTGLGVAAAGTAAAGMAAEGLSQLSAADEALQKVTSAAGRFADLTDDRKEPSLDESAKGEVDPTASDISPGEPTLEPVGPGKTDADTPEGEGSQSESLSDSSIDKYRDDYGYKDPEPFEMPSNERSKSWIVWLIVAIVAGAGGAYAYVNRDTVVPFLQTLTQKARELDEQKPPVERPKIEDRVGGEEEAPSEGEGIASEIQDTDATDEAEPETPETPTDQSRVEPEPLPVTEPTTAEDIERAREAERQSQQVAELLARESEALGSAPVAAPPISPAILYQEGGGENGGDLAFRGQANWSAPLEPGIPGSADQAIKVEIAIPARALTITVYLRQNTDTTLPASHTVELQFSQGGEKPEGGIANIGGILMKPAEPERGSPLVGAAAKVTDEFFIVGLSDTDADQTSNTALLKEQEWIDIPVVFGSGKRGIITLQKGPDGNAAFETAFAAWEAG